MERFSVYKHIFKLPSGTIARRNLIVFRHYDGTLTFTNFGKYVATSNVFKSPASDGGAAFHFVVKMLNYCLHECGMRKLNDLTIDMVKEFVQKYASGALKGDVKPRTKETVIACTNAILTFLVNYIKDNPKASITEKQLYKKQPYRDRHFEAKEKKVPVFDVITEISSKTIFRDIPNEVFSILLNLIATDHTELLGAFIMQSFAGLRPSEACNVRREDSALGPGILIHTVDGDVVSIKVDVRHNMILRSDGVVTGGIKKPRLQKIPVVFINSFMEYYNIYLNYLQYMEYEEDYGPLNINRQGKALAYRSYYNAFNKIVKEELMPICLASEKIELVEFGRLLMENNLSPHALRHWYTVQLVLSGYGLNELMSARGDKSPESCLWYLQNKGELEKLYKTVVNDTFDYLSSAAEQEYGLK